MSKRRSKRIKRHHLKRFSANVIGVSSQVDRYYFREAHQRAQAQYQFFPEWFLSIPDNVSRAVDTKRRAELSLEILGHEKTPAEIARERARELEREEPLLLQHYALINSDSYRLLIFHSADKTRWRYYEYDSVLDRLRWSKEYPSQARAERMRELDRIHWTGTYFGLSPQPASLAFPQ